MNVVEPAPPEVYASVAGGPTATVLTRAAVVLSGATRYYGFWNVRGVVSLWSMVSGPGRAVFAAPTNPNTTVSFSSPGTYVLKFAATAGSLAESTTVTVNVVDNLPPVVTASTPKQIIRWPSHSVELTGSAASTSPKGSLEYRWTQVSGTGQAGFANPNAENTTATFSAPGVYSLQLCVTDGVTTGTAAVWVNVWPKVPGPDANIVPPVPRQLSQQPPPFVHPRYFFSDADRQEMADRALNDPIASKGIAGITQAVKKTLGNPSVPLGRAYQKMLAGDLNYSIQSVSESFYELLSQACYLAWLNQESAKLRELASVTANAARNELTWITDQRDANFCLCYDLTYNSMTEDQRVDSRALVAKMSWGGCRDLGCDYVYSNAGYFYSNVNSIPLAIYGEPGFNNALAENNFKWSKVSVTTWGITQGGWGRDDIGYHGFGMSQHIATLLAFSRQYEPLHVTSRLAIGAQMEFYQYAPNTTCDTEKPAAYSHGDGIGFSQKGALYQFYKYFYPTDPLNDFVCRIARRGRGYFPAFYDAMFGVAPLAAVPSYASVAAEQNMPLTKFDPQRGIGTTRSDWSANAASLDFDCRFDMFNNGHIHADRNNFTFFALGREWVDDAGFHQWASDQHATVIIDGTAQGWYTPGKFLDVIDHTAFTLFAGDATASYNYDCKYPSVGGKTGGAMPYNWTDFMFPGSSDGVLPAFTPPPATFGDYSGFKSPIYVFGDNGVPKLYNPVQRAFRTAILVRGSKPYALIIDDIQKDDKTHDYQWSFSTREYSDDMQLRDGATATDAIMYHASDAANPAAPQCLVRAIQADGIPVPIALGTNTIMGHPLPRLRIERKAVAPNFKVLLFPHLNGEPLPTTTLKDNVLTVKMNDGQTDQFTFTTGTDGRTRVGFKRPSDTTPPVVSVPDNLTIEATKPGGETVTFRHLGSG